MDKKAYNHFNNKLRQCGQEFQEICKQRSAMTEQQLHHFVASITASVGGKLDQATTQQIKSAVTNI